MNPGLLLLLRLRWYSGLRRLKALLAGARGKALLLFLALIIVMLWAAQPELVYRQLLEQGLIDGPDPHAMRLFVPPALLLIALLGARAYGFYFKPPEVQWLFPAPISRRQLLLYNILSRVQTALFSAATAFLFSLPLAGTVYGAFIGIFLMLVFIQLTGQLTGLLLAIASARGWRARAAWLFFGGNLMIGVLALNHARTLSGAGLGDIILAVVASPVVQGLSWIASPGFEIVLAPGLKEVALWSIVALGILLVQILLMLSLDGIHRNSLVTEPSFRIRRAYWWSRGPGNAVPGLRIPPTAFPRFGGAGPLAWRQCQELLRNPSTALRGAFGMLAVMPIVAMRAASYELEGSSLAVVMLLTSLFAIPMLVDGVDFRRDLDRMAALRALPLSPLTVSIGQLAPTALLLMVWLLLCTVLMAIINVGLPTPLLLVVGCLIPPYALLTAALDNLLFLLMPYRPRTRDPGEATYLGRLVTTIALKALALFLSIGICVAVTSWIVSQQPSSPGRIGLIAFITLSFCCVPAVYSVAWAFNRFDVSREIAD